MNIDVYKIKETDFTDSRTLRGSYDHKNILAGIFSTWKHHIEYMPLHLLKANILESISLANETLEWKNNSSLKKKINALMDFLEKDNYTRKSLMLVILNTILSADGFSNLHERKK